MSEIKIIDLDKFEQDNPRFVEIEGYKVNINKIPMGIVTQIMSTPVVVASDIPIFFERVGLPLIKSQHRFVRIDAKKITLKKAKAFYAEIIDAFNYILSEKSEKDYTKDVKKKQTEEKKEEKKTE